MDASFDDRFTGQWTDKEREESASYQRAKQQSEQALRDALAVDGLELLHGSDCRCVECCNARKKAIP